MAPPAEPLTPPVVKQLVQRHPARTRKVWPEDASRAAGRSAVRDGPSAPGGGCGGEARQSPDLALFEDATSTILGLHW